MCTTVKYKASAKHEVPMYDAGYQLHPGPHQAAMEQVSYRGQRMPLPYQMPHQRYPKQQPAASRHQNMKFRLGGQHQNRQDGSMYDDYAEGNEFEEEYYEYS